jgi:hypothetical protein
MQELVEMIRRDHALLDGAARAGDGERYAAAIAAHRDLLDGTIAPLVKQLGVNAEDEYEEARTLLLHAEHGDLEALRSHAEHEEQVVLARLLSELDQSDLSDATREVMRRHEELGLGSADPSAMRATFDEGARDSIRPAGA